MTECKKNYKGLINSTDYTEKDIYILTDDLKLDVIVKTTHKEFSKIVEEFEEMTLDDLKKIFVSIYYNIKKITNIDEIYLVQPIWSNLMGDCALFYAARWVLFKKPIPLVEESSVKDLYKH